MDEQSLKLGLAVVLFALTVIVYGIVIYNYCQYLKEQNRLHGGALSEHGKTKALNRPAWFERLLRSRTSFAASTFIFIVMLIAMAYMGLLGQIFMYR